MVVKSFTFNPFMTNCYICHDESEGVLVDPSCATKQEQQAVLDYLVEQDVTLRHLLLTHAHIDHIFGCALFAERYGQAFQMHRADLPLMVHAQKQAAAFGVALEQPPQPDDFLEEGDTVCFGSTTWEVLHTPGHSPGSVCFYDPAEKFVVAGDVLFQGSIGRTDLWEGSLPQLMESIFQKLVPLGEETVVYPGHGPRTTIGAERRQNPFLTDGFGRL